MRIEDSWNDQVERYTESLWAGGASLPGWGLARESSDKLNKTGISLGLTEARLVAFLIRQNKCQKFVEIGTLTGASALWILQALPSDGRLWTLEKDPAHAAAAREVLKCDARATILEGDARETLKILSSEGPFDGIFIDGNKAAYGDYLAWAEANVRAGGLIIADNVFLSGAVFASTDKPETPDSSPQKAKFSFKQIEVMRAFNRRLADSSLYDSTLVPTPEGLLVAVKK